MKILFGTFTGCLLFTCSGILVSAQHPTIPFKQLESKMSLSASVTGSEPMMAGTSGSYSSNPGSPAAFSYAPPSYKRQRVMDSKFLLVNGLDLGLAALDIALTQHCIAVNHCKEGNPLMPSSLAGQVGVNSAIVGYGFFVSYRMKKHDSKAWWLSPVIGIGAHTAGAVTGFMNR